DGDAEAGLEVPEQSDGAKSHVRLAHADFIREVRDALSLENVVNGDSAAKLLLGLRQRRIAVLGPTQPGAHVEQGAGKLNGYRHACSAGWARSRNHLSNQAMNAGISSGAD